MCMRECEGWGEGGTRWMSIVAIKIWVHQWKCLFMLITVTIESTHVGTHEDSCFCVKLNIYFGYTLQKLLSIQITNFMDECTVQRMKLQQ